MLELVNQYAVVRLTADLSRLTPAERKMIPFLIKAAGRMDDMFRHQAGDAGVRYRIADKPDIPDPGARRYHEINYGPWDRLRDNEPFLPVPPKPLGANFYPPDLTREEFEAYVEAHPDEAGGLKSDYTMIRRLHGKKLVAIPYHVYFEDPLRAAAETLREAARLAEDAGLKHYLELRAEAFLTDQYRESDLAWLDMKQNRLEVVIGPIETYEDRLFGYKTAFEAYVLVKDVEWSRRLEKYADLLPDLQRRLPVPDEYKKESPGTDSDLNAYDVIYYAGDCNAGVKTIAINLPNDEVVQLEKGTRRLQLKNAMRAKFDRILMPIVGVLIASDQQKHVTFEAFFGNTMFHEVAHGLGIKNTIDGRGAVRQALRDEASALEEGKADILGLYMVEKLFADGVFTEGDILDHYVTFLAGIFRSVRFGASSAHGRANMLRFNFFKRYGAFRRDGANGRYRVVPEKMASAVAALSRKILVLQGDGDYAGVKDLVTEMGSVGPELQRDLDRLAAASIPVDIVFEQGLEVLGLK